MGATRSYSPFLNPARVKRARIMRSWWEEYEAIRQFLRSQDMQWYVYYVDLTVWISAKEHKFLKSIIGRFIQLTLRLL